MKKAFVGTTHCGQTVRFLAKDTADFLSRVAQEHNIPETALKHISQSQAPAPVSLP